MESTTTSAEVVNHNRKPWLITKQMNEVKSIQATAKP